MASVRIARGSNCQTCGNTSMQVSHQQRGQAPTVLVGLGFVGPELLHGEVQPGGIDKAVEVERLGIV
jgi:hypothetical protein